MQIFKQKNKSIQIQTTNSSNKKMNLSKVIQVVFSSTVLLNKEQVKSTAYGRITKMNTL